MAVSGSSVGGCKRRLGGPSYQASVLLSLDAVMCCAAVCHHKYMEMPSCWPLRVHSSRLIPPSGPVRPAFAFISSLWQAVFGLVLGNAAKKLFTLLDLCVSSLRRGHANILCILPNLTDDPRRESRLAAPFGTARGWRNAVGNFEMRWLSKDFSWASIYRLSLIHI